MKNTHKRDRRQQKQNKRHKNANNKKKKKMVGLLWKKKIDSPLQQHTHKGRLEREERKKIIKADTKFV